tara:strand:+ start:2336 stop:2470 length:135 start_codon:yes stop_codon:yes gene_type:complete
MSNSNKAPDTLEAYILMMFAGFGVGVIFLFIIVSIAILIAKYYA